MSVNHITPVILSGGSGTRLWPLSRGATPKQMLALTGEATMLQMTAARVRVPSMFAAPMVVTSHTHSEAVAAQLAEAGVALAALIEEPCARNTAPAIALAALVAEPDALLLVMPSDHIIRDEAAFQYAVGSAAALARQDWLVTFGISPQHPETGYGYIRRGRPLAEGVFEVERFVEKPDLATATAYLSEGCYDWNGGIFLFRAGAYLAALADFAPAILAAAREGLARGSREGQRIAPDFERFAASPPESIDNAVMEKSGRVAVVPVEMGWSDVGSWDALYEMSGKDDRGNVVRGDVLALGAGRSLLRSDGPLIVAVGVEDLIVVATPDAVLIMPREESQRVKEAVNALKEKRPAVLD